MADTSLALTQALQTLIEKTVAALGEEKKAPFEIEAYYEMVEDEDGTTYELCPRVKITKR